MSTLTDYILIIGGSSILSLTGMYITRKRISRQALESCHEVGGSIYRYAVLVEAEDWSKVEEGMEAEETIPIYQHLWKLVTNYKPTENTDIQSYSILLNNMEDLSAARRYRMVAAKNGLSSVLWAVLIAGGVLIVLFSYFFFLESLIAQTLMIAFVAIFISMNVYLIYICQNPYRHEFGAKKACFGYSFTPNWFKETK